MLATRIRRAVLVPIVILSLVAPSVVLATARVAEAKASSYKASVLQNDPSLYWRLDESGGTAANDSSGNGNDGTYSSSDITYGITGALEGRADTAVAIGSTGSITSGAGGLPSATQAATYELWFNTTQPYTDLMSVPGTTIEYGNGGSPDLLFGNNAAGRLEPLPSSGNDGSWHLLDVTTDGAGNYSVYFDGVFAGTLTGVNNGTGTDSNGGAGGVVVGNTGPYGGGSLGAALSADEVAVYPTQLAQGAIDAHWTLGGSNQQTVCPTTPTSAYATSVLSDNPALYLRLDELATDPAGRVAFDSSTSCTAAAPTNGTYGPGTASTSGALLSDSDTAVTFTQPGGEVLDSSSSLPSATEAATYELWFNTTQPYTDLMSVPGTTIEYGNGGSPDLLFGNNAAGRLEPLPSSGNDGSWHLLDVTTDGAGNYSVYFDGVFAGTLTGVNNGTGTDSNGGAGGVVVGNTGPYGGGSLGAALSADEVAVYPTQLAQGAIDAHYQAAKAGPCSPLALPNHLSPTGQPEPKTVVIMVPGIHTAAGPNDYYPFDPAGASPSAGEPNDDVVTGYCYPYSASQFMPGVLNAVLTDDPSSAVTLNEGTSPDTKAIAMTGALLLPFGYEGAYLTPEPGGVGPLLHVSGYDSSSSSDWSSAAVPASYLEQEIQSVHSVWPDSPIDVVADSGGGVVALAWWDTWDKGDHNVRPNLNGFPSNGFGVGSHQNVQHVITLDSPLNGVAAGLGCSLLSAINACNYGGGVAEDYNERWASGFSGSTPTYDDRYLSEDTDGSFIPIGTHGDEAFDLGDFNPATDVGIDGLFSQIFIDDSGNAVAPDVVDPCDASQFSGGSNQFNETHTMVEYCPSVSSRLSSVVSTDEQAASRSIIAGTAIRSRSGAYRRAATVGFTGDARLSSAGTRQAQISSRTASPGGELTITGSGFGSQTGSVSFVGLGSGNGSLGSVVNWSDTSVTVTVPAIDDSAAFIELALADGSTVAAGPVSLLGPATGVASIKTSAPAPQPGGLPETVSATALDASDNPVAGATIDLTGTPDELSAVTGANGRASFHVRGFGSVPVELVSGSAFAPAELIWTQAEPDNVGLSATTVIPEPGLTVPMSISVSNSSGAPVAGATISVDASSNGSQVPTSAATVTTNAQGQATVSVGPVPATPVTVVADAQSAAPSAGVLVLSPLNVKASPDQTRVVNRSSLIKVASLSATGFVPSSGAISASIDWGDGSSTPAVMSCNKQQICAVEGTHDWIAVGDYTVKTQIEPANDSADAGDTSSMQVVVTACAKQKVDCIDSPAADAVASGASFSFTVTTSGLPTPTIRETGTLPVGVTFRDLHSGSAVLSGTPQSGNGGTYPLKITARFGTGTMKVVATQTFTLTVT